MICAGHQITPMPVRSIPDDTTVGMNISQVTMMTAPSSTIAGRTRPVAANSNAASASKGCMTLAAPLRPDTTISGSPKIAQATDRPSRTSSTAMMIRTMCRSSPRWADGIGGGAGRLVVSVIAATVESVLAPGNGMASIGVGRELLGSGRRSLLHEPPSHFRQAVITFPLRAILVRVAANVEW